MSQIYHTPEAAARAADVTARTITNWAHRYPTLARKVGGRWRIDPTALDRLIAGQLDCGAGHAKGTPNV
jgi:hypothetical protein